MFELSEPKRNDPLCNSCLQPPKIILRIYTEGSSGAIGVSLCETCAQDIGGALTRAKEVLGDGAVRVR